MDYDVIVVGGGPAGMAAALSSSDSGASTLLIERGSSLGGILNQCIHNGFGLHHFKEELTGPEYAQRFIDKLHASNVKVMLDTFVTDIKSGKVTIMNKDGKRVLMASSVVLAMGCRERTAGQISLAGSRPVGVYTAGAVQKMVNFYGKMPGKKIVILGSGDIGLIMARRLYFEGAKVEMVLEIASASAGLARNIQQCLVDFDIPLFFNTTVTRIVGSDRITGIYYAQVDEKWNPILSTEKYIDCDCLILSVGLIPETDLMTAADMSRLTSGYIVDENQQTSQPGIFACGNVLHVHDLVDNVTAEALLTGAKAAAYAHGKLSIEKKVAVTCGEGVRYTVPNFVYKSGEENVQILFRVGKRFDKIWLTARSGGKVIAKRYVLAVAPGEMQEIKINKAEIADNLIISVEEKIN